jgi:hypothetical protein
VREEDVEKDKELPEKGVVYDVLALHGIELDVAMAHALGRSIDEEMLELSPRTKVRETAILIVIVVVVKKKIVGCPPLPISRLTG